MCARDVSNKGPGIMNPLEVVTEQERAIYEAGNSKLYLAVVGLDEL